MNPEIKPVWLAALRGDDYKQGDMFLHDQERDTHCCLGVLAAEVVKIPGAPFTFADGCLSDDDPEDPDRFCATSTCELTREFAEHVGISHHDESALIKMNDDDGLTFSQIADWIEANL